MGEVKVTVLVHDFASRLISLISLISLIKPESQGSRGVHHYPLVDPRDSLGTF